MNTFFVSTNTQGFRRLLQTERSANLFIEVLYHYRAEAQYLLHEFVVMPDHVHLILSPQEAVTIEKSMQLIKGGSLFGPRRLSDGKRWFGTGVSMTDACVTELSTPVLVSTCSTIRSKRIYAPRREDWPYSSVSGKFVLDEIPQRLKPLSYKQSSHG
jgi:REP element-mobilizing transposase RayT